MMCNGITAGYLIALHCILLTKNPVTVCRYGLCEGSKNCRRRSLWLCTWSINSCLHRGKEERCVLNTEKPFFLSHKPRLSFLCSLSLSFGGVWTKTCSCFPINPNDFSLVCAGERVGLLVTSVCLLFSSFLQVLIFNAQNNCCCITCTIFDRSRWWVRQLHLDSARGALKFTVAALWGWQRRCSGATSASSSPGWVSWSVEVAAGSAPQHCPWWLAGYVWWLWRTWVDNCSLVPYFWSRGWSS